MEIQVTIEMKAKMRPKSGPYTGVGGGSSGFRRSPLFWPLKMYYIARFATYHVSLYYVYMPKLPLSK